MASANGTRGAFRPGMTRTVSRTPWLGVLLIAGCAGEAPASSPPDASSPDAAAAPTNLLVEPAHGLVIEGDPATISIHVAGVYSDSVRPLSVQLLANPDDLSSWQTIATTTATIPSADTFQFAIEVQPVTGEAERVRWPTGGVLRLRVVDDAGVALPHDAALPEDTVVAVVNPAAAPATWTYLVEKQPGSIDETIAYYTAIDAPLTLDAFLTRYGLPGDETSAAYYNAGDLGIGREMHCRATDAPAGGLACYVRNFGTFGGTRDDALAALVGAGPPLATVAMVYTPPITAPNAVAFIVYGPDGARINEAQLDTHGDNKSIPQNCLNCHGGRSSYDLATHAASGARFLAFDPAAFDYALRPDLTFAAQEDKLRRLDRLVANASPTAGVIEMIEGMYPTNNTPYDPLFVPAGWNASPRDARVYREVIAPYCRGCHASFENAPNDPLAFPTAASVKSRAASVLTRVCGIGPKGMPTAEATTLRFFGSSARALLLAWLERPGACAPAVP
jgi:hypothetical protein